VKRRDLEAKLVSLGWSFLREGGNHAIWQKDGKTLSIPRHKEINELTAKGILKRAQ
jgi:mRNA interferase HicA